MGTRTMVTTFAATLAIGVLGTAAAGAETEEELQKALAECEAAGGELIIEETETGTVWIDCVGGTSDVTCAENGTWYGDDWICVPHPTLVARPVPTTGGYGGTGTVSEPTTRPQLALRSAPILHLG